MSKISDLLDAKATLKLIRNTIRIGSVYTLRMDKANGITPHAGEEQRTKIFIVLGVDDNEIVYGGVVVNSQINPRLPRHIADYYYPVSASKYSFLSHDSFVNCSDIKTVPLERFEAQSYLGVLHEDDLRHTISAVVNNPSISKMLLRKFNITNL